MAWCPRQNEARAAYPAMRCCPPKEYPTLHTRGSLQVIRRLCAVLTLACSAGMAASAQAEATLDAVRERGHLLCGVSERAAGFAQADERGQWSGLEVEYCAALAAAVLGDAAKVKYRPLAPVARFAALQRGDIDVLAASVGQTLSRDTELGVRFTETLFFDGQSFLVRRAEGVTSVLELSGATICVLGNTSAERALSDYFRRHDMRYRGLVTERWEETVGGYLAGNCTILTGDLSTLAFERSRMPLAADQIILPELITKDPLGPVVRQGDEQWASIVRWSVQALIAAEELGLSRDTIQGELNSLVADVRRFVGRDADLGRAMGLDAGWAYRMVHQVGNYGEIFDRTLGSRSPLLLDRGLNRLWTNGGLMIAAPLR